MPFLLYRYRSPLPKSNVFCICTPRLTPRYISFISIFHVHLFEYFRNTGVGLIESSKDGCHNPIELRLHIVTSQCFTEIGLFNIQCYWSGTEGLIETIFLILTNTELIKMILDSYV